MVDRRLIAAANLSHAALQEATAGRVGLYVPRDGGSRTQAQQDALFAQGRTRPGPIVTWTRNSRHVGGRAIDLWLTLDGRPVAPDDVPVEWYEALAELMAEALPGVRWGGRWSTPDRPHFEI